MKLPAFDEKATCPKCGHAEVRTNFAKDTQYCGYGSQCWGARDLREHLHRTCGRCLYQWNEAPIDAVPPRPAPGREGGSNG